MIVYISVPTSYCHSYGLPIHPPVVVEEVDGRDQVVGDGVAEVDEVGHHPVVEVDVEDDHPVEAFRAVVVDEEVLVAEAEEVDPSVDEEVEGVLKQTFVSFFE
jgi:hypothetical protein